MSKIWNLRKLYKIDFEETLISSGSFLSGVFRTLPNKMEPSAQIVNGF